MPTRSSLPSSTVRGRREDQRRRQQWWYLVFLCCSWLALTTIGPGVAAFVVHPTTTMTTSRPRSWTRPSTFTLSMSTDNEQSSDDSGIDVSSDSRLYQIRLPRALGIEWGTDLSFSFVYIRDLDPTGAAAASGKVQVGDQLCQLTPVINTDDKDDSPSPKPINLVGAPFDYVMNAFATLDKTVIDVDLVFFRGTKDELKAACANSGEDSTAQDQQITVTVIENKGKEKVTHTLKAEPGVNIRELLTDNGINVYQSVTRWTNCKGKQLCGTCIVNVTEGGMQTNRKSMDEESTLRENPDSYRLSCVSFAYGDITVETFPPIKASQWTR